MREARTQDNQPEAAKVSSLELEQPGNTMSDLARRYPTLAVCGVLLVGLAFSRFCKSSSFYTSPGP
jgi:hypothetical protein